MFSCSSEESVQEGKSDFLFTSLDAKSSGIDFENRLVETTTSNYYQYMYSYIGGGVAAGDFNNDGLEDLFFVSNREDNKLYLNKGDLKFEDITSASGLLKSEGFDAGVTTVDINNDGWLDIYLSRGGSDESQFANMLWVHNGLSGDGLPTFTEMAAEYGLADSNRGINATFFDYDNDGDVDVYISNTPDFEDRNSEIADLVAARTAQSTLDLKGSDRLYANNGSGIFTDVSSKAGLFPEIGFGLNAQVGDINHDGWQDIYVCNDFRIPDYVYINNGDGTFREARNEVLKHMSFNSMGGDIADINNDGLLDVYTLDMNPSDYIRSKTTMGMTMPDRFQKMVDMDHHYQYMHNMLQVNNGNGTFSEIANMAGVANTDWSWSCLLADFDLDGYNDIFVTNGVYRDVIDKDQNKAILEILKERGRKPTKEDFLEYAKMLPQQKLNNCFFKNNGDLSFSDVSEAWKETKPTFSNGAVYSDLDNDGDLDLAINNLNEPATILRNNAREKSNYNFIEIELTGPESNRSVVGVRIEVTYGDEIQVREITNSRGFLSSVSNRAHFGLGDNVVEVSVRVNWPDGKTEMLSGVVPNKLIRIDYKNAQLQKEDSKESNTIFKKLPLTYSHTDPTYDDYQQQILLPHKLSQTGPAIAVGDVNGDGLDDMYMGGGNTQSGQLLLGRGNDQFRTIANPDFDRDKRKEDVDACFFDADNDGDQDLYVVSGSYEFGNQPRNLVDRLYLNDGKGNMKKSTSIIPEFVAAGSVVTPADFDNDGDIDLFVGSRVVPGRYPFAPTNYLLINDRGTFSIQTSNFAPELEQIGMITDAKWVDIDKDGDEDLIVTGEWMGIEVFLNENNKLNLSKDYTSLSSHKGWWNTIEIEDVDQDGDWDIIAGNLGLNSKFLADTLNPFHVYTNDFDYNGSTDVFLATQYKDQEVPIRGKTCATQQLPHLGNKIGSYNEFANSSLSDIIGPGIKSALHLEVTEFRSGIFKNNGGASFVFEPFPQSAQRSPINSIVCKDFDKDGVYDLLLAGNNHMAEIETTKYDAGIGTMLKGSKGGQFKTVPNDVSGFWATKDVRNVQEVRSSDGSIIVVVNNNDIHEFYKL